MTYGFIYHAVIELTQFKEITEHSKPKRENRTTSFHNRTYEQECRVKKLPITNTGDFYNLICGIL